MVKDLQKHGMAALLALLGWVCSAGAEPEPLGPPKVLPPAAEKKPETTPDSKQPATPPAGGRWNLIRKIVRPTTEQVKHTRICYDVKELDYAGTWCLPTPILTPDCPDEQKHAPVPVVPLECVKCGQPYTRKVLLKKVITETVTKPKCEVQRLAPEPCPCARPPF
jgi:hypothetical protein